MGERITKIGLFSDNLKTWKLKMLDLISGQWSSNPEPGTREVFSSWNSAMLEAGKYPGLARVRPRVFFVRPKSKEFERGEWVQVTLEVEILSSTSSSLDRVKVRTEEGFHLHVDKASVSKLPRRV